MTVATQLSSHIMPPSLNNTTATHTKKTHSSKPQQDATAAATKTLHEKVADRHAAKHAAALSKIKKAVAHDLDDFLPNFNPKQEVVVKFPSGKKAALGKELSVVATLSEPQVTWEWEDDAFYTIIMTDPDVPSKSNPKEGEFRHWVVANIPGGDVAKGEEIQEYMAPSPPTGVGLHRYIILVYGQKKREELRVFEGKRTNWQQSQWTRKLDFELLGVNWFTAQEKV